MAGPNTGKTFLLKVGGTTVAGQSDTALTRSTGMIDLSNKDTSGYRVKKPSYKEWGGNISGKVYADNTQYRALHTAWSTDATASISFSEPDGGAYSGTVYVTSIEERGGDESPHEYSITLEGTGALTYAS